MSTVTKNGKALPQPSYQNYFERFNERLGAVGCRCGLSAYGMADNRIKYFALEECVINAKVNDLYSTSIIRQTFLNKLTVPVEASYRIPLPPNTSVTDFVVTYQNQRLQGAIKTKDDAFNTFSDAIANGYQSFLAEVDDSTFVISIGNIPPPSNPMSKELSSDNTVTIETTIQSMLGTQTNDLHYYMHKCFFPTSQYSPNFSLTMNVQVELSSPIQNILVQPYKHNTVIEGNKATITVTKTTSVLATFLLSITPSSNQQKPLYHMEYNPTTKSTALGITFYPQFDHLSIDDIQTKGEFIFLIDCSGSMAGFTIEKAKKTLQILMRSLPTNSYFNIYCFGGTYKSLFQTSVLYDDDNLAAASEYISSIDANMGGTQLISPLKRIYDFETFPNHPRQIFIITDGEIPNRDYVIDFVASKRDVSRIFTVGLGSDVDKALVTGLSNVCGGYYELVTNNATMETQVLSLMARSVEPALTNIKIDWKDLQQKFKDSNNNNNKGEILISPQTPPFKIRTAFNNERLMLYYLIENMNIDLDNPPQHSIQLICDDPCGGKELAMDIDLDWKHANIVKGSVDTNKSNFNSLVASHIISMMEKQNGSPDKIKELGLKYGVVSTQTSYVVVSESGEPVKNTMQKIFVGQTYGGGRGGGIRSGSRGGGMGGGRGGGRGGMPLGGGGIDRGQPMKRMVAPPGAIGRGGPMMSSSTSSSSVHYESEGTSSSTEKHTFSTRDTIMATAKPLQKFIVTPSSLKTDDLLFRLISSQKAVGNWTDQLIGFDKLILAAFESSCKKVVTDQQTYNKVPSDVWTTLLVLVIMNKHYQSKKVQFDLVASKAIKYIKSNLSSFKDDFSFDQLYQQLFTS
ncbi:type A von Willebrand factor domain-containing protein [Cavenderia fasciculata]|uniref:Type A von Willebrand factor domain-containing protein n=1 Tax=Cavenderia fasciculata TaxID=261658 RepID=F4Q9U8_CACFS|nr:type A von Willebrand factor domain-containing protein [Cavenderia fasciculata]EGG15467.1 type A von Willebrand factor domain-containing protein [Cavenderia fasciculata]|eukprot:XP_004354209.1 type A von Willebrand factor domain-containing protein [Cavenderia fasciculata]